MNSELDADYAKLAGLADAVVELRATVGKLESLRDELLRDIHARGGSGTKLSTVARVNRSRVYQIIAGPGPEADDWDHHEFAERFAELWDGAVMEWMHDSDAGAIDDRTPDDYFPLERLVERRN